jgi:hypothetical protein
VPELPPPIPSDAELDAMAIGSVVDYVCSRLDIESVARVASELKRLVDTRIKQYAAERDEHAAAARDYGESMAKLNGILMGVEP